MILTLLLWGCLRGPTVASPPDDGSVSSERTRPFAPSRDGAPALRGISYGPYRRGQSPDGPFPTAVQIREDLRLLQPHFQLIRTYGSRGPTETLLEVIREDQLPFQVMVGAWIAPDKEADNAAERANAIRLAKRYPDLVIAVSVGNETQVSWSSHRSKRGPLIDALREVRSAVQQPVTTADDYNFWNLPEAQEVAEEVDFICLHAYAMWNGQSPEKAMDYRNRYGVDGIMIGRASIGAPWVFREMKHYMATGELLPPPGMAERVAAAREHFEKSVEWKGDRLGVVEMRRHYANYFKGLRDFKQHRLELVTLDGVDDIRAKLDELETIPFEPAI